MSSSLGIAGIAWFSPADYAEARRIMVDAATLPETYQGWLRGAETAERDLREQGHHPIRVVIVPADFAEWCSKRRMPLDLAARRQFVRYVLAESQQ